MELINLPAKTDYNMDSNVCFSCDMCTFLTYSIEHLEKHTAGMHTGTISKFVTKEISYSDSISVKLEDELFALVHEHFPTGKDFLRKEIDTSSLDFESTSNSKYIDNEMIENGSSETKLEVKDYSTLIAENFAIGSTSVKVEIECDNKRSNVFSQDTTNQEIVLSSMSDCKVKEETMFCESCLYNDVDWNSLKSHIFLEHPTNAAFVTNNIGGKIHNVHDVSFLCIKETCSFSTSLYNVYEKHLMSCCPLNQTLSGIEKVRLKSTITFVLDFHKKNHLAIMSGFLDYVSVFNKICMPETDHENIVKPLLDNENISSVSLFESTSNSVVKSSMSYDNKSRNSENLTSSVPFPVFLVTKQNRNLRTFSGRRDPEEYRNNEQLLRETAPDLATSEEETLNVQSNFDNLVANNAKLEIDVAGESLCNNNISSSQDTSKEGIDPRNKLLQCAVCHETFDKNSSLIIHMISHTGEKMSNCNENECDENFSQSSSSTPLTRLRQHTFMLHEECVDSFSHDCDPITHVEVNKDVKAFKGNKCVTTFSDRSSLTKHLKTRSEKKSFIKCNECDKSFGNRRNLTKHLTTHTGKKPFECKECGECFGHSSTLNAHLRIHTGKKPFKCNECGESFGRRSTLIAHLRKHTGEKPFKCHDCGLSFGLANILTRHLRTHTRDKPVKCNECGRSFRDRSIFTIHLRTHTGERPFECNECGKSFRDRSILTIHLRTHTEDKPVKCNECGKSFRDRSILTVHLRTHTGERSFKCNECGKSFGHRRNLTKHLRRHAGKKPFECKECGECFGHSSTLNAHLRIHTGKKPFKCIECGESFGHSSTLNAHLRIHISKKPFKCNECGESFGRRSTLTAHLIKHTEKKPFKCHDCGLSFGQANNLNRHLRTHTGDKTVKCNECGKSFRDRSNLTIHLRTHTGERPFQCNECGKTYFDRSTLNRHFRTHWRETTQA